MPPNIILEKEFDFLLIHFSEYVIFSSIEKFIKEPKTFKRAIDFCFKNDLFHKYSDKIEELIRNLIPRGNIKPNFLQKEILEYFLTDLISKTNFMHDLNQSTIKLLIKCSLFLNFLGLYSSPLNNSSIVIYLKLSGSDHMSSHKLYLK